MPRHFDIVHDGSTVESIRVNRIKGGFRVTTIFEACYDNPSYEILGSWVTCRKLRDYLKYFTVPVLLRAIPQEAR